MASVEKDLHETSNMNLRIWSLRLIFNSSSVRPSGQLHIQNSFNHSRRLLLMRMEP